MCQAVQTANICSGSIGQPSKGFATNTVPVVVLVAVGPARVLEVTEAVSPKCPEVPADASDTLGPGNCDYSKKAKVHCPILLPTSSESKSLGKL